MLELEEERFEFEFALSYFIRIEHLPPRFCEFANGAKARDNFEIKTVLKCENKDTNTVKC